MVNVIDLNFQGYSSDIAAFLVESGDGPILIETGPYSTFSTLEKGIQNLGYRVRDIRHILLTHIHFDHAGAAWAFAKQGAKVYLHPVGARHMEDPFKLYESARRIYKDKMDSLWGKMEPIKKDHLFQMPNKEVLKIGNRKFVAHHTPGHATHHIAWQVEDILFTGDVAGIRIKDGPVMPPCPPPDIDIEAWKKSINVIRGLKLSHIYLTHFAAFTDISSHLDQLEKCLDDWVQWIKIEWERGRTHEEITPEFQQYVANQLSDAGLSTGDIAKYEAANPSWMSVTGLIRYWHKKRNWDS